MDEWDQLARDQGLYWALRLRRQLGSGNMPWPGTVDQARKLVDLISTRHASVGERERLARLLLERAKWAWGRFRTELSKGIEHSLVAPPVHR